MALRANQTKTQYYPLGGGLDVVTPALSVNPGRALAMVNFEPWYNGGYRRIDGFERYDGRPQPHLQDFTAFEVSSVEDLTLAQVVTGGTSGTTGVIIGIYEATNSLENDAIGVTKVSGSGFVNGETLTTSTNVDTSMQPDADATDTSSVLAVNNYLLINEGIDNVNSLVNTSIKDDWPVSAVAQWTFTDLPSWVTSLNSWTLRVRARVVFEGTGDAPGPEFDDLVTYRFQVTLGAEVQNVTFTEVDTSFVTKTVAQGVSTESTANANAAVLDLEQTAYTENGEYADGIRLEIQGFDLIFDVDGNVNILSLPTLRAAPTSDLEDEWLLAAQDDYRDDIAVVPGAGRVHGVWQRGADVYAWRDNVGATACVMHMASASGWTTSGITLADTIRFDAGLAAGANVAEGDTLTGGTSGATATIHRIVLNGGSVAWDGSGEGYFVLTNVVGGPFQDNEALESPALTQIADADGANSTFGFTAGGTPQFQFHNHNFFGGAATYRAYGCNGLDPAFEIDENGVVSPILLPKSFTDPDAQEPPANNTPFLIEEHQNILFLAFPGGSVQASVVGEPLLFSGFLGAAEFGLGDEVTGMNSVVGDVLVLTTERETRGLYGRVGSFELRLIGEQTGGKLFSTQKIDTVYALDDLGITNVARTDAFGDFVGATVSRYVQPIVTALRERITTSTIVRESNQYRVYFNDNTALIMFVPAGQNQEPEFGFCSYPFAIERMYNSENATGEEVSYFANDIDGYVYRDRVGNNFDGVEIQSYVRTAFNQVGTPSYRKRFRRADLELNANKPLTIQFVSDLTYGSAEISSSITELTANDVPTINVFAGGGFWDTDNWDEFFWDGQAISTARAELRGTGENIGFLMFHESAYTAPFVIQGITLHYDMRRLQR